MPTAMVNTMLASTQRGRYCSGPVRNRRTRSTIAGEGELRDLASRAGPVRHRRLRRAAVDDERAAHRRGGVRRRKPEDVGVLVDPLLMSNGVDARGRRALGDDHHEARDGDRQDGQGFAPASRSGRLSDGKPPCTGPMTEKPWSARWSQALAAIAPTTTTSETGNFGANLPAEQDARRRRRAKGRACCAIERRQALRNLPKLHQAFAARRRSPRACRRASRRRPGRRRP